VKSKHSTLNISPDLTVATAGMSGCHRLWKIGRVSSVARLVTSIEMTVLVGSIAILNGLLSYTTGTVDET